MIDISVDDFEKIVAQAMDDIPAHYRDHMKNVGFVIEDFPTPEQHQKLHLCTD
jgi:predicted Zn-dependent protease with MMP-like domain